VDPINIIDTPQIQPTTILEDYSNIERDKILKALLDANGSKTIAAKTLGMTRTKLYRKLKELNGE
jgi:transcriptional regulator of acetoin/glycerol metabolism